MHAISERCPIRLASTNSPTHAVHATKPTRSPLHTNHSLSASHLVLAKANHNNSTTLAGAHVIPLTSTAPPTTLQVHQQRGPTMTYKIRRFYRDDRPARTI